LHGGKGHDTFGIWEGVSAISPGEPGDDVIHGDAGDDTLNGGAGIDRLDGGPGNDLCLEGEQLRGCES
jgi:Ca2+-binding RTX toxin-like protein